MSKYFILFSNCIPVKGYLRSVICDLQMGNFEFIPNELYDILIIENKLKYSEIIEKFSFNNKHVIDGYFNFLIDKGFGFWSDNLMPELPELSLKWKAPQIITNALIDVLTTSSLPFDNISKQLDELNCVALEIRFFNKISYSELDRVLSFFSKSTLRSISVLVQNCEEFSEFFIKKIVKTHPRISNVNISNCDTNDSFSLFNNSVVINKIKEVIDSVSCCGVVRPKDFSVGIEHFSESIGYNTCLNRKISINSNGDIMNCPSMNLSYGNINNTSLKEILDQTKFKNNWNIRKDQIEICKDCEFRHICTDCRAYTEAQDKFSKPIKCNYNPYKAIWES